MKKYLLLIEDEKLWERFKDMNKKNINDEIFELIKEKVDRKNKKEDREKWLREEIKKGK